MGNAVITICSDQKFSLENARIWAFGNNGSINFEDGNICIESEGLLNASEYMVGLVRFEENLFNTQNISTKTFDEIYESAMSTVDESELDSEYDFANKYLASSIAFLFFTTVPYLTLMFVVMILFRSNRRKYPSRYMDIDYKPLNLGKKINKRKVSYYREIPCDGDLYYAYWVLSKFGILKPEECKNGLIGAMLLRWIKEGHVELTKTKGGFFSLKDNKYAVLFNDTDTPEFIRKTGTEQQLLNMFVAASGSNRILEAKEFEKWCKNNYTEFFDMFDK